MISEESARV